MPNDSAPAPAQVPPAAAPGTQQPKPEEKAPKTVAPPAPAKAPAAEPAPKVEDKKEVAAAEPAPATKKEEAPAAQPAVLKIEDLKLPAGSMLDPKAIAEIVSLANEKKLSKEDAQGMLERESKIVSSYVEGEKEKATKMQQAWYEAAFADPEIGAGKDELYNENMELGMRLVKKYGTPGFEKVLKDSGAYEHPEVLKFIIRVAKAHAPDKLVLGGAEAPAGGRLPRLADRLYGKTAEKKSESAE